MYLNINDEADANSSKSSIPRKREIIISPKVDSEDSYSEYITPGEFDNEAENMSDVKN